MDRLRAWACLLIVSAALVAGLLFVLNEAATTAAAAHPVYVFVFYA